MRAALAAIAIAACLPAAALPRLDLEGFQDGDGAITVQHRGDTVDPYFALQALLLAQRFGLDAAEPAGRWIAWLMPRQKLDATFDRFCRRGPVWGPCKTADADDALHALWMQLLETHGVGLRASPARESHARSAQALARLQVPPGVYHVSPVYSHALFMDNLEVWSRLPRGSPPSRALAQAIEATFWDAAAGRYRVTTQPAGYGDAFYPDAVAQIYPLLLDYPLPARDRSRHYRQWMREHRGKWLAQGHSDFAWGVVALVAWREGDRQTAACWLRESLPLRRGAHWTVSDEVAFQVLAHRGAAPAPAGEACA